MICSKLLEIKDKSYEHFFQYLVCDQDRDNGKSIVGGVIYSKSRKFKHLGLQRAPQFSPLVKHHNLPIRKILRRVLGLLTVMISKRVNMSIFLQSKKLGACKVKVRKRWHVLWWHSIFWRLSIHFKVRSI